MKRIFTLVAVASLAVQVQANDGHQGPSYDCEKADGTVEEMICQDAELSKLDLELTHLYVKALKSTSGQAHKTLKAYQRGWIKGRNECWKANDVRACVASEYKQRIKDLTP